MARYGNLAVIGRLTVLLLFITVGVAPVAMCSSVDKCNEGFRCKSTQYCIAKELQCNNLPNCGRGDTSDETHNCTSVHSLGGTASLGLIINSHGSEIIGQSNLTQGRIAAADGRFNRIHNMPSHERAYCSHAPMRAYWRHLAKTIELVLPAAYPPQPKRQIDRFSRFCTVHGRKSLYFTMGDHFP